MPKNGECSALVTGRVDSGHLPKRVDTSPNRHLPVPAIEPVFFAARRAPIAGVDPRIALAMAVQAGLSTPSASSVQTTTPFDPTRSLEDSDIKRSTVWRSAIDPRHKRALC